MARSINLQVKNINHLGLIAGIIDEIGIEKIVNEYLGFDSREIITPGKVVKAIILNAMGFVSRPLYLFPQFFEDKAIEHLLGEGIEAAHLNDDKIGRVMDKLYQYGTSIIFLIIALSAQKQYGIKTEYNHLDATSLSLHGRYKTKISNLDISQEVQSKIEENSPQAIKITQGYSRDHRPELKQFIIDLIVSGDGDIPLFLRVGDGNEADKAAFGQIVRDYKAQIDFDTMIVADSALYSANNLKLMEGIEWLCRVPLSIKESKKLVEELSSDKFKGSGEDYSYHEVKSSYAGVKQRWLVVESQPRKISDLEKINKKIKEEEKKVRQQLKQLRRQEFSSESEIKAIIKEVEKELKYHQITEINIVSNSSVPPKNISKKKTMNNTYCLTASIELSKLKVESLKKRAGRFVLATNRLDSSSLSSEDMLNKYKEQQSAERGFRFIKDPLFFADSVFLKSPERIETMAMLMGLCLLVYSIGQRQLRLQLKSYKTGLKNQLGKLTERPTLRWIFQCFQGIHLVLLNGVKQIVNLTEERARTLSFFPPACQQYYLLTG